MLRPRLNYERHPGERAVRGIREAPVESTSRVESVFRGFPEHYSFESQRQSRMGAQLSAECARGSARLGQTAIDMGCCNGSAEETTQMGTVKIVKEGRMATSPFHSSISPVSDPEAQRTGEPGRWQRKRGTDNTRMASRPGAYRGDLAQRKKPLEDSRAQNAMPAPSPRKGVEEWDPIYGRKIVYRSAFTGPMDAYEVRLTMRALVQAPELRSVAPASKK
jgi:hypothetical protein